MGGETETETDRDTKRKKATETDGVGRTEREIKALCVPWICLLHMCL